LCGSTQRLDYAFGVFSLHHDLNVIVVSSKHGNCNVLADVSNDDDRIVT
jgi:hypothetical protein